MSLEFRELNLAASAASYRHLFSDAFPEKVGSSIATEAHYRWKFFHQPGPVRPCAFGAYAEEALAGFYGSIPLGYRIGGEAITAALICDVMTMSHMRGRGVFTRLGQYALDQMQHAGIHMCMGYPIRAEVIPGHLKVGWRILFALPIYLKILHTREILQKWRAQSLAPAADLCLRAYWLASSLLRSPHNDVQASLTTADALLMRSDLSSFLEMWSVQTTNCLVRTVEFLRWRTSAPEVAVDAVIAERASRIAGIALARSAEVKGVHLMTVLDFLPHDAGDSVAPALHKGLDELAFKKGASGLALMTTPERAREWRLFENGYVRSPFAYKFIVRWLAGHEMPPTVGDRRAWHLTWLDTDCF